MKKFIKLFSYTIIMALTATMVSGCSKKPATTTTTRPFTIWSFEDEDVWKPLLPPIKKSLGNKEVVYVQKKLDSNYEIDSLNSILSGEGPDVWAIPNDWVYRHKDKLISMPEAQAKTVNLDNEYVPLVKQNCYINGKIVCLSQLMDPLVVYYHQDIFNEEASAYAKAHPVPPSLSVAEKEALRKENERVKNLLSMPPSTWTDFAEAVRRLTVRNGADITRSGVAMGTSTNVARATDILYTLMLQNGTEMASDDLKLATFSLPEKTSTAAENSPAKRAIDFYTSFSNPTSEHYSWNASMPKDVTAFMEKKTVMMFGNKSLQVYFSQNFPTFSYKTAVIPQIGDSESNIVDWATGYSFAVPVLSNNPAVAWETVLRLAKVQYAIKSNSKLPTSGKDKNFTPSLEKRSPTDVDKQIQTAKTWAKGRYPIEVDNIFKAVIDKTNTEPNNSQAFLDNAAIEVTNLYKRTEW